MSVFKTIGRPKEWFFCEICEKRKSQSAQTEKQFCRAGRWAYRVFFTFRAYSDLLAEMTAVSARPIYSDLLDGEQTVQNTTFKAT